MALLLRSTGYSSALTMVLIGKTGAGKSASGNTLLQKYAFTTSRGGRSATVHCERSEENAWGRNLAVIDTPGTMDVRNMQEALDELENAIRLCPNGIDAYLLAFRCDVRCTEEEVKAAEMALDAFGSESYNRTIMVFTHAEEFDNDAEKISKEISANRWEISGFDALMSKFDGRWAMLDNRNECDQHVRRQQVNDLLSLVESVSQHNPKRYYMGDRVEAQRLKIAIEERDFDQLAMVATRSLGSEARHEHQLQMMSLMAQMRLQSIEYEHQLECERMNHRNAILRRELEEEKRRTRCVLL